MFRIFDLIYLTSDSNVWDFSRVVSVKFFFPGHTFLFLCMLYNSFLRIRYSEYYSWLTLEIKFSHFWGIADLCLLRACPFVRFPNYFLQSVYSFLCGHWSFCSVISVVSQWPDKDFLKCLAPKRCSCPSKSSVRCSGGKLLQPERAEIKANVCTSPTGLHSPKHTDWTV